MGSNESKITYEYAAGQGQQQAQEENKRRMRELQEQLEKDRDQALRDAQESARFDDDNQRRILALRRLEREERERLIKKETDFRKLQNSLMNYDFHTSPRMPKESFRGLDVADIGLVRIALIGPAGSGKSSFVGTLQRALGENQVAFEQGEGKEGDILLQEYYVQKNIRLVDTRGFFESDEELFQECLNIISGRIRPGEEIVRNYDPGQAGKESLQATTKAQKLAKQAHAVIFVVKANDIRLELGLYAKALGKIRGHFKEEGYIPVTAITGLDLLKGEEVKEKALALACWATGCSNTRAYLIANYTHMRNDTSLETERAALDILDYALLSAEEFIRIRKQREKNKLEREVAAEDLSLRASSGVETIEQFFARLMRKHNWTDQGKMKEVVSVLRSNEINTVRALKELWEDVKPKLPLSIGMKQVMELEFVD